MSQKPKDPLRKLTEAEERALQCLAKASSERADVVKRTKAILAVRAGKSHTQAAQETGYKSGDSISRLVGRFNQQGLAALQIAPGRGRKEIYTNVKPGQCRCRTQRRRKKKLNRACLRASRGCRDCATQRR